MFRSSSETTTSTTSEPLSPFSICSLPSEATSEELPDLGAFTTVLRELNYLQPGPRVTNARQQQSAFTPSSVIYDRSQSDLESDSDLRLAGSTVWSHRPIASYLSAAAVTTDTETDGADSRLWATAAESNGTPEPQIIPIVDELSDLDYHSAFPDDDDDDPDDHEEEHQTRVMEELDQDGIGQPSLGYLDEALSFIAGERERWNAQREVHANSGEAERDSKWKHGVESRRKRRRKRTKTPRAQSTSRTATTTTTTASSANPPGEEGDADDSSSSSYDPYSTSNNQSTTSSGGYLFKSTPATPSRKRDRTKQKRQQQQSQKGLRCSRSTPSLKLSVDAFEDSHLDSDIENPRALVMRSLAKKLAKIFPEDKVILSKVQFKTLLPVEHSSSLLSLVSPQPETGLLGCYIDTRGPPPKGNKDERLIHVFVDHSNILIGLLNYLKRYPHQHPQYRSPASPSSPPHSLSPNYPKPPRHLSHSALSLILERGRPVTRRVLVTSSPLYQPMEGAEQLGFEVRVFARVPDTGDGMDRERGTPERGRVGGHHHGRSVSNEFVPTVKITTTTRNGGRREKHTRKVSGGTSTESDQANGGGAGGNGFSTAFIRSVSAGTISASLPASSSMPTLTTLPTTTTRIRYREQGVDELLQLKLHQALASIEGPPPPGSTIILATGDGNAGQFNEDGFLGSVRTALKKGWRVELYAWEGGLSKAWKREFGETSEWGVPLEGETIPRFRVVGMEQFGAELVEIYF